MLDTVAITLNHLEFDVTEPDAFDPSARGLLQPPYYSLGARGNFSCKQNPTKRELEQGVYKPRVTLTKRFVNGGFALNLRIEFSAPKLLFHNNFDELQDTDFDRVLDVLHRKISGMGIRVRKDALRKAQVSAIHYSKNVALTDYSTCSMITGELAKVDLSRRLDLSRTDYRNEGHAIRYHANSYEVAFYDKMKDLEQAAVSEKRAIEPDNAIQRNLFNTVNCPKQLEVLRMEVRLGNRTKIKKVLALVGVPDGVAFQDLFSAATSQKVLLHFWGKATQDMPVLALSQFRPEDLMLSMLAEGKGNAKPAKLLQRLGALALVKSIGMRGVKAMLIDHCTPRTWQRLKKELEGLDATATMKYAAIRNMTVVLSAYDPLRLASMQAGLKR